VWLLVAQGTTLAGKLSEAVGPGGLANESLAWAESTLGRFGITPGELTRRARAIAGEAARQSAGAAETLLGTIGTLLLGVFFAMLTMHFILRHWDALTSRAQQTFPLRPEYTRALFAEFRRVGRETLLGTVVTGLAQGAIATIGFWIAGVPEPLFFGAATALASLVPAVGTLLVWVPVGVALILLGHPARGVVELVWGAILIVGLSDYVIRPRLVGGGEEIPSVVTFAALFGGVEVFGLKGLILGPVVVSLAIAVLRLYSEEMREQRADA
jgi:predicted PurR-regulated permease PerM